MHNCDLIVPPFYLPNRLQSTLTSYFTTFDTHYFNESDLKIKIYDNLINVKLGQSESYNIEIKKDFDINNIKADCKNGILIFTIPKITEQIKTIKINY